MSDKKVALSQADYINAALLVVDDEGVDKFSMRKIALKLGVTPMAVYRHFQNKEELLACALDAFIARANVIPSHDMPWKLWVTAMAEAMYAALCQERQWLPLLNKISLGHQASSVMDSFVSRLMKQGFSQKQANQLFLAMLQIVVGSVCLQQKPMALSMLLASYADG